MKRRIVYAVPAEPGAVMEKTAKPKKATRTLPRTCPSCKVPASVPATSSADSVCDSCKIQVPLW